MTDDLGYLARVLGYTYADHHQKIGEFITRNNVGAPRSMVLAPRGAGKSTITSVIYPIWRLIRNPELRILIVSASQAQSVSFLREIKGHLEKNPALKFIFGAFRNQKSKWTDIEVEILQRRHITKEASITVYGIFGALIGRHYDLIILDDVVDQENSRTEAQRLKIDEWFKMSLSPTLEPGGQMVVVGTRYHTQDMYGRFGEGVYKDDHLLIRAIEGNESFWPDFFPLKWLEEKKMEIGTAAFNAQYQNDPQHMTGGIFKREWLQKRWNRRHNGFIIGTSDYGEAAIANLDVYQGMDLAISQRTTADFTVHCTVGHDRSTGVVYVLDLVRGRFTPMEQEALVKRQYRKWEDLRSRPKVVAIESIAYQDALPRAIASTAPYIPVRRIKPYKDKVTRANSVAVLSEQGRLIFPFDGSADVMVEELVDFPNGAFDDCVDALELCITGSRGGGDRLRKKPKGM